MAKEPFEGSLGYTSIHIQGKGPFDFIDLYFDPEVNVFIGPNATGKSTILNWICPELHPFHDDGNGQVMLIPTRRQEGAINDPVHIYFPPVREVAPLKAAEFGKFSDHLPPRGNKEFREWLYSGNTYRKDLEIGLPHVLSGVVTPKLSERIEAVVFSPNVLVGDSIENHLHDEECGELEAAAYPVWASIYGGDWLLHSSPTSFNPAVVYHALHLAVAAAHHHYSDGLEAMTAALEQTIGCIKEICPEVVKGFPTNLVERSYITAGEYRFEQASPEAADFLRSLDPATVHYAMSLPIAGPGGEPLAVYIGRLSTGTQGLFWWVLFLAMKLAFSKHQDTREINWNVPGVLCIDEIENHLHPTWQRRVIPALRRHFPGVQIFATTHSPFVVAGLKAGQVHLLQRDDKGVITASTNEWDVIGWTADEILQTLMGVDEPTDELTVNRAARLRQLREKETLTTEEETELNELRRQVNADLLARGGDADLSLDDYASLMRQVLLSRQSDLTQEG